MYISQSHRNLFATVVNAKSHKINRVSRPVIPGNICLSSGPFYKIHYLLDFLGKKDEIGGGHGRTRTRTHTVTGLKRGCPRDSLTCWPGWQNMDGAHTG